VLVHCIPPAYGQFLKANGEEPVTWKRAATMEDVLREADVVRFIILQYSIYYYIYIDIISTGIHTKEQLNCTIN